MKYDRVTMYGEKQHIDSHTYYSKLQYIGEFDIQYVRHAVMANYDKNIVCLY